MAQIDVENVLILPVSQALFDDVLGLFPVFAFHEQLGHAQIGKRLLRIQCKCAAVVFEGLFRFIERLQTAPHFIEEIAVFWMLFA